MTGNHNTKVDTCGYLFSGMILQTSGDVADVLVFCSMCQLAGGVLEIFVFCVLKKRKF